MWKKISRVGALARAAVLFGSIIGGNAPALAGSDRSTNTYAGDYALGSLPTGTFGVLQYLRYARADAFIDTTGRSLPNSRANIFAEITRLAYLTSLWGHPFVVGGDLVFATLTDVNIPGTNNRVAGGRLSPDLNFTYFITADQKEQRWLGVTNFFFLPLGRSFDRQAAVNVATARQFTDALQVGYTEGLGKISPAMNGVFFDLIAYTSFHTNGDSPLMVVNPASAKIPGILTYGNLTQPPTYNVRAFLRYASAPFQFVAIGIERSWGGKQTAINGTFTATGLPITQTVANLPLTKDEFLRGHFQIQVPITHDFGIAANIFRIFGTVGGFRDSIGVEIRMVKIFLPPGPAR
ncbi:MAG: hypothetical protein ACREDV_07490 [Methylocella sp.]